MKRYALFAGECYYPWGGWEDYRGVFDSVEEAKAHYDAELHIKLSGTGAWWHVVDMDTREVVSRYDDEWFQ